MTETRKVANWCDTHYINIAPHNPLGPISTAACLHLDLSTSNFGVQELVRSPNSILPDVFPVQVSLVDGHLLPPKMPRLGIVFDEKEALDQNFRMEILPQLHQSDGSFTNW